MLEARSLAGDKWEWNVAHIDRLAGTDQLRLAVDANESLTEVAAAWNDPREAFELLREKYLLYGTGE